MGWLGLRQKEHPREKGSYTHMQETEGEHVWKSEHKNDERDKCKTRTMTSAEDKMECS